MRCLYHVKKVIVWIMAYNDTTENPPKMEENQVKKYYQIELAHALYIRKKLKDTKGHCFRNADGKALSLSFPFPCSPCCSRYVSLILAVDTRSAKE